MEMYYFVTDWFFLSPIEKVWEEISDIHSWPNWWTEFKKASIQGQKSKLQQSSVAECEVRGGLSYTLCFSLEVTSFQPPKFLRFKVTGDLEGDYQWVFDPRAGGTAVTAYWDCGTPKVIMDLSAKLPFVKGILERNHQNLMSSGYRALKARLEG